MLILIRARIIIYHWNKAFFTKLGAEEISRVVNSELSFIDGAELLKDGLSSSPQCMKDGTGCPIYFNPKFVQYMLDVAHLDPVENIEYLPCRSKNPAPGMSAVCKEFEKNGLKNILPSAEYPVNVCHYPKDNVSPYYNMEIENPDNTYLKMYPTEKQWLDAETKNGKLFKHMTSSLICSMHMALDVLEHEDSIR